MDGSIDGSDRVIMIDRTDYHQTQTIVVLSLRFILFYVRILMSIEMPSHRCICKFARNCGTLLWVAHLLNDSVTTQYRKSRCHIAVVVCTCCSCLYVAQFAVCDPASCRSLFTPCPVPTLTVPYVIYGDFVTVRDHSAPSPDLYAVLAL